MAQETSNENQSNPRAGQCRSTQTPQDDSRKSEAQTEQQGQKQSAGTLPDQQGSDSSPDSGANRTQQTEKETD